MAQLLPLCSESEDFFSESEKSDIFLHVLLTKEEIKGDYTNNNNTLTI